MTFIGESASPDVPAFPAGDGETSEEAGVGTRGIDVPRPIPRRRGVFFSSASDNRLTRRVLDHHGKTTRCRSAVYHGRGASLYGSDAWISWREYG